jgi:hypothetical protein
VIHIQPSERFPGSVSSDSETSLCPEIFIFLVLRDDPIASEIELFTSLGFFCFLIQWSSVVCPDRFKLL